MGEKDEMKNNKTMKDERIKKDIKGEEKEEVKEKAKEEEKQEELPKELDLTTLFCLVYKYVKWKGLGISGAYNESRDKKS